MIVNLQRCLRLQRAPVGREDHPRQAGQRSRLRGRDLLIAQQEEAGLLAARKAVAHHLQQAVTQGQDLALQRHQVGIGFAVENHHVHRQAAEGPPGLGAQQRPQQRYAVGGMVYWWWSKTRAKTAR